MLDRLVSCPAFSKHRNMANDRFSGPRADFIKKENLMRSSENEMISVLIVDDEAGFREATGRVLSRRGFLVDEAESGKSAIEKISGQIPDLVLLDLKMPGMGGIETLQEMRRIAPKLPVIILTGHGDLDSALAGIQLEIVDFITKPVDMDLLASRIQKLLNAKEGQQALREKRIRELMVPAEQYQRIYADESVGRAASILLQPILEIQDGNGLADRSILVYDRRERFIGMIRYQNLLRLVVPPFLAESPYPAYFTGMFLAQCKLVSKREIEDLIDDDAYVEFNAPLIEAVHIMVTHHLVDLPVLEKGKLVGVLREKELIGEIAEYLQPI